jgi:predicted Zn-dependent protease
MGDGLDLLACEEISMRAVLFAILLLLAACATSPLGRSQLQLLPADQLNQMGLEAFQKVRQTTPRSRDPALNAYVQCVADAITAEVGGPRGGGAWDVVVFREPQANAFALPGGKIGVYTGLLDVARTQGQLAAVIGHEVAHVIAQHHNERVSQQLAVQLVSDLAGGSPTAMALLGIGAQVGILLPYSRIQESEADKVGLDLMASAGFDPREAIDLWRNMERASGSGGIEFLSTHPSSGSRVRELQPRMGRAMAFYQNARAQGKHPRCGGR